MGEIEIRKILSPLVNNGVEFLNKECDKKDWWRYITIHNFDMQDCHHCLIGQLIYFLGYSTENSQYGEGQSYWNFKKDKGDNFCINHGFQLQTNLLYRHYKERAYYLLRQLWIEKIIKLTEKEGVT